MPGGFPPLELNIKKDKKEMEKRELKSQFFSDTVRKNINIREILTEKNNSTKIDLDSLNNNIEEVDDF